MEIRTLRLLIVKCGVGDAVLLTAAIRQWKHDNPQGRLLAYVSSVQVRDVLRHNPHLWRVRMWRPWHRLIVLLPQLRAMFPKRYAFPSILFAAGLRRRPAARLFAESLAVTLEDPAPELFVTEAENAAARERLRGLRRPVSLHTSSASSKNKHWHTDYWEELLRRCPDYTFVQVGLQSDEQVPGTVDLRGLSFRESIPIIGNCVAHVGIDSSFSHVAAALRIPAVVLFGATSPEVFGHASAENLYTAPHCSPCAEYLSDGWCPYERACMRAITPAKVARALSSRVT